jgi:hypothetical protein
LNEAFGEEADLVELSRELHARGMVSLDIHTILFIADGLLMCGFASISWLILLLTIWRTWAAGRVSTTGSSSPSRRYVQPVLARKCGRGLLADPWQPQASYYHSPCSIDYDSQTSVEVCVSTA